MNSVIVINTDIICMAPNSMDWTGGRTETRESRVFPVTKLVDAIVLLIEIAPFFCQGPGHFFSTFLISIFFLF